MKIRETDVCVWLCVSAVVIIIVLMGYSTWLSRSYDKTFQPPPDRGLKGAVEDLWYGEVKPDRDSR